MRTALLALCMVTLVAGAVIAQPAAPLEGNSGTSKAVDRPNYIPISVPDGNKLAALIESRAPNFHGSWNTTVKCTVLADTHLSNCHAHLDRPGDQYLAEIALIIASATRVSAIGRDGRSLVGEEISVPMKLRVE